MTQQDETEGMARFTNAAGSSVNAEGETEGQDAEGYARISGWRTEDAPISTKGDDTEGGASGGEGDDTEGHLFKGKV